MGRGEFTGVLVSSSPPWLTWLCPCPFPDLASWLPGAEDGGVIRVRVLLALALTLSCAGEPEQHAGAAASPVQPAPVHEGSAVSEPTTPVAEPTPEEPALPAYRAPVANAVELRSGAAFSCLLRAGRVLCWGNDRFHQLGVPTLPTGRGAFSARPLEVEGLSDVRALALGSFHACALLGSGHVRCWGHGGFGQLGDGRREDSAVPVEVAGLERVTAVAAGEGHSCAVVDGMVRCWGSGARGQLGDGRFEDTLAPVSVTGLDDVIALGAGRAHTCALRASHQVACWGEDVDGELGRGAITMPAAASATAQLVVELADVAQLRVGWGHACALNEEGEARCWGRADAFQLGVALGGAQSSVGVTPVLAHATEVRDVAPGGFHTCFALASGHVSCVGADYHGQLGNSSEAPAREPLVVPGLAHVRAVAAGESHSCALLESGEVRCWGNPHSGRVGPHAEEHEARQISPVRVIAPVAANGASTSASEDQAP